MSPLLLGAVLGATGAFLLDPEFGRRRRARVRDKVTEGRDFAGAAAQDLRHRARGLRARLSRLRGRRGSIDDVLMERVRAKLGRYCSHPRAVEVTAFNGHVVLTGDVLSAEQRQVVAAVRSMRGVEQVDNKLAAHASADDMPSPQGRSAPDRERFARMDGDWSPGMRLMAGGTGALLLFYALARGGLTSIGALGAGAVLLGRASMNRPLRRALSSKPIAREREAA
jgi:hypothetical protein